jgi:hypothetical protein
MKKILVLLTLAASISSVLAQDFDVNSEITNAVKITNSSDCRSFLVRMSWLAENSNNDSSIVAMMRTVRVFKDNIANTACPVQEFNAEYLILKMYELIGGDSHLGYDSHSGIKLKHFSQIRTAIQNGESL